MSNVLVQRLAIMFGPPDFSGDAKAFIAELSRLTQKYGEDVLNKAADLLIREHRPTQRKPWPVPNEICMACADAAEMVLPSRKDEVAHKDWTPQAIAKAYDLIRSPMGRTAGDEGWVLALWNFCRRKGRLPNASEAHDCKQEARGFNDAYAMCKRGEAGACGAALINLAETMLHRRDQLARHAHGEDVPRDEFKDRQSMTDVSKRITGERDE